MGLRTKAYFIGAYLTFFSSLAAALGFGEIKLNSALNQPLNAEIQLLHVRDLTAREIIVDLASPAEFERAGVERTSFITGLKFNVDLGAAQGPVVRITSEQPVREPFLNFIVTAQWPSGKLLREYTLLVDLPVFSGSRAAPVQVAPNREPATTSQTRPTPTQPVPQSRPQSPASTDSTEEESTYGSDTYGPVGANENLWSIASRVKPGSSVSVQQTMLAIQRLNPEAFINNNINLLRRGQVLRIPDVEEIQSLTGRQAMREVAEQNSRWSNRSSAAKAQLEGSKSFTRTRDEPGNVEGRIKLSSPAANGESGRGTGVKDGEPGSQVAEALTQAQEELDAADRENSDLKSRLQSVEEQIQTMEKLVEVSSEEMRALELAAQQTNQSDQSVPVEPPVEPVVEQQPVEQPVESAATETPEVPVEKVPPAPAKSWMDLAMANILYIGIGAGVLVLALAAFLFMRRKDDGFDDDFDEDFAGAQDDFDVPDAGVYDEDDHTVPLYGSEVDSDAELFDEPVLAEAETEDVVGECDIHIAYGQYDQAEEKLVRALEKDPTNVPIRLKLMEVFAAQGDVDSFDYHYARLQRLGDAESLDRAANLRNSIDGAGDFDASAYDTSDVNDRSFATGGTAAGASAGAFNDSDDAPGEMGLADDTLAFDFNEVDDLVESSSQNGSSFDASVDELDFDLQLDDDAGDVTRVPAKASDEHAIEEFDTDLGDLEFELGDLGTEASDEDFILEDDLIATESDNAELAADDEQIADDELSFDFERSDNLAASSFDDLDDQFDLENEQLTREFSENLVAETSSVDLELDEQSLDFADLDLDADSDAETLDFDLDRDLESAKNVSGQAPLLTDESGDEDAGLAELGLEDLEDLDIDLHQGSVASTSNRAAADSMSDFDVDFDIDGDVNLDALDHELDALASDFSGGAVAMEEPVVDFDDLDRAGADAALESEALKSTAEGSIELEPDALDLDDALVTEEETYRKPENLSSLSFNKPVSSEEAANSALDFEIPDFDPENDDDSNLDFLSDNDETATKLDLARAYIDMGDSDGAKDILDEILDEGTDQQKREAEALLARIG